jgi:hypothetical protein
MKKNNLRLSVLNIAILLFALFFYSSCEEKITYGWSDINESLGLLQEARKDLKIEISNLENDGYDSSELEDIDKRLKRVESILDKHFN